MRVTILPGLFMHSVAKRNKQVWTLARTASLSLSDGGMGRGRGRRMQVRDIQYHPSFS